MKDGNSSPAQRMFGRHTKTLIPAAASHLTQSFVSHSKDRDKANKRRAEEAWRFNQRAKDLKPLQVGTSVRIQPSALFNHTWAPGTIMRQLAPRSYEVQTAEGTVLRRDRHFMRPTHEQHTGSQFNLAASRDNPHAVSEQTAERSALPADCRLTTS